MEVSDAPAYSLSVQRDTGQESWMLPVWNQNGRQWRIEPAAAHEVLALFENVTRSVTDSFNDVDSDALIDLLRRQSPTNNQEFASFLASLLLRPSPDDRAIAAKTLATVGGLSETANRLTSQLLIALMYDDQIVATEAIESLKSLGTETHGDILLVNLGQIWGDIEVSARALLCIGELGGSGTINALTELYREANESPLTQAIDASIGRIYERHDIPKFDPVFREQFIERVRVFQYDSARQAIDINGSAICLALEHRKWIKMLVEFANSRSRRRFDDASLKFAELIADRDLVDDSIEQDIHQIRPDFPDNAETKQEFTFPPAGLLSELFFSLDCAYLTRNYTEFSSRLYNYVEQFAAHVAGKTGVLFERRKDGSLHISKEWSDANKLMVNMLKERGIRYKSLADRNVLAAIVEESCDDKSLLESIKMLRSLESLIRLRHRSVAGHGTDAVGEQEFSLAYGADLPTLITDIRRMHTLATDKELGENPYLTLNKVLDYLLSSADQLPPSAASLLYRS